MVVAELSRSAWAVVDRLTRAWWQVWGRRVDDVDWLDRSVTTRAAGGEAWLENVGSGGRVRADTPGAGLLADMRVLDGEGFRADDLDPMVRDFYEHTSRWDMDVGIAWSRWFAPGGWLIERFFGRRVQQLAIPVTRDLSTRSMSSQVSTVLDEEGAQVAAAWTRRLRPSGELVYSGRYSTVRVPPTRVPIIQVTFPLEDGNVQVLLTPRAGEGGSLHLSSPSGTFGDPGAYVVVRDPRRGGWWACRLPLHEEFHVYVDTDGVLRTDHDLRLWRAHVVRLRYRLTQEQPAVE